MPTGTSLASTLFVLANLGISLVQLLDRSQKFYLLRKVYNRPNSNKCYYLPTKATTPEQNCKRTAQQEPPALGLIQMSLLRHWKTWILVQEISLLWKLQQHSFSTAIFLFFSKTNPKSWSMSSPTQRNKRESWRQRSSSSGDTRRTFWLPLNGKRFQTTHLFIILISYIPLWKKKPNKILFLLHYNFKKKFKTSKHNYQTCKTQSSQTFHMTFWTCSKLVRGSAAWPFLRI